MTKPPDDRDQKPTPLQLKDDKSPAMLQHLVAELNARDLVTAMRDTRAESTASATGIANSELIGYALRGPGAPMDFRIERAIRSDRTVGLRYRRMLQSSAIGYSELAMAAGTGTYPSRRVGAFDLRVVEDGRDVFVVLSQSAGGPAGPQALEAIGPDDSVRIPLSEAVRGHIQIAIDPANGDLSRLLKLLGEATTELYLI
ncbi:MAG TPA: hypothetical protein PK264_18390 [Hyphomicrobiaceae bacterium]|nr:hypothetical protein [Hyphomicrobiaceae bacterium]